MGNGLFPAPVACFENRSGLVPAFRFRDTVDRFQHLPTPGPSIVKDLASRAETSPLDRLAASGEAASVGGLFSLTPNRSGFPPPPRSAG
jgi:hypothetical protein